MERQTAFCFQGFQYWHNESRGNSPSTECCTVDDGGYNEEVIEPSGMPGRNWSVLLFPWRIFPANKIRFGIVILEANLKICNSSFRIWQVLCVSPISTGSNRTEIGIYEDRCQ